MAVFRNRRTGEFVKFPTVTFDRGGDLCSSFEQFNKPGCINTDVQRQTTEALLTTGKPVANTCMRPEFMRPAPPLHIADDEVGAATWGAPLAPDPPVSREAVSKRFGRRTSTILFTKFSAAQNVL